MREGVQSMHIIHPLAVKQHTLEDLKLSANPNLHQAIVAAAKQGMEHLIDYLKSPEYEELYKDTGDVHPKESGDKAEEKDKDKKEKKDDE